MQLQADPTTPPNPAQVVRPAKKALKFFVGLLFVGCGSYAAIRHFQKPVYKSQLLPSAVYYHRVKRGMTQEAVEKNCGRPEYAQQMSNLGDEAEAWYYSASDGAIEIFFDEGKVKIVHRQ